MGLDTSHNCWHGSYGSFHKFRKALAAQINIDLESMSGFENIGATEQGKSWEPITHKIKPLLTISDCEGQLSVAEAKDIAEGLHEIIANWDINKSDSNWKEYAQQFIEGCVDAVNKNEVIDFH